MNIYQNTRRLRDQACDLLRAVASRFCRKRLS